MHDAKLVHEELCSIAKTRLELYAREAHLLVLADELEIWRELGCASLLDYLERYCDLQPRTGREYIRVARALAVLPNLRAKLDDRSIKYSTARELTRVATPETELEWLSRFARSSARDVEDAVAGRKRGDRPDDPRDPHRLVKLTLDVRESTYSTFMETRSRFRDEHGDRLSDDEVAMAMCCLARDAADDDDADADADADSGTDAADTADAEAAEVAEVADAPDVPDARAARRHAATTRPAHQLSLTTCRSCAKSFQLVAGRQVEIPRSMLEAAQCDAIHIGDLESDAPQRAVSSVTPAIRRQVLARDGYRCTVPGCRSKRFLQLHHIVPQADGGEHKPSNLTVTCFAHHLNGLHDGKLEVTGRAPHALAWSWPSDPERTAREARRRFDVEVGGAAHVGHASRSVETTTSGTGS